MTSDKPHPESQRYVHSAAQSGYGHHADAYARGRPSYPPALEAWLRDALGLHAGSAVVEVGAGTGKFTPLLLDVGATVAAIEPVDAMRAQLHARLPAVRALPGTAQELPLATASADAIVCAQAFHWFATRAALDEFARVLKPGGMLGLVWNQRDERCDWVAEFMRIVTPYAGSAPLLAGDAWRTAFPHPAFGPLAETALDFTHAGPPERVIVDHALSISFVAAQPEAVQAEVRGRIHALIATHPALRGQATVRFPFRTRAFACRRALE